MAHKFAFSPLLTVKDLMSVWDELPSKYTSIISLSLNPDEPISAKVQFGSLFEGRLLLDKSIESAKIRFKTIFYDNIFILLQIQKQAEVFAGLTNFDNWADVTKVEHELKAGTKTATDNEELNIVLAATTDSNSATTKDNLTAYMDVKETEIIPANALSQNKTHNQAKFNSNIGNETEGNSITNSSNASKDYIQFMRLELPSLRLKFWEKFTVLFRV